VRRDGERRVRVAGAFGKAAGFFAALLRFDDDEARGFGVAAGPVPFVAAVVSAGAAAGFVPGAAARRGPRRPVVAGDRRVAALLVVVARFVVVACLVEEAFVEDAFVERRRAAGAFEPDPAAGFVAVAAAWMSLMP
jgi:hypothetical protein